MKLVRFLLLIISVVFCCSCSSDTNEIIPEQPTTEDVFYVRYVVNCISDDPNSVKEIHVGTGTGNHITQLPIGKESKWEATYGPIKSGANAYVSCQSEDKNDGSIFYARIEVRKNNEPFVLKKEDRGKDILIKYIMN